MVGGDRPDRYRGEPNMKLATIFVRRVRRRAIPRSVGLVAGLAVSLALILWLALSREDHDCPWFDGVGADWTNSPIEPYPYHPVVVPRWTPDGAIMFSYTGNMYVIRADGSGMKRLHGCASSLSISPDASRIAYVSVYRGGRLFLRTYRNREIETSKLDGSDRRRITFNTDIPDSHEELADTAPAWLPDGSGIVFVRDRGVFDEVVQYGIYTVASDGSNERAVVNIYSPEWPNESPNGEALYDRRFNRTRPALSPNGKMVAFVVEEFVRLPPEHPDRGQTVQYNSLYVVALDGSGLTRLFSNREIPGQPALIPAAPTWNPKLPGQLLFLVNEYYYGEVLSEPSILYSISTDGSEPRIVAKLPTHGDYLEWSPAGTQILVSHSDPHYGRIYIVDPNSGRWSMVSLGDNASWSPDGSMIAMFSTGPPLPHKSGRYATVLSTMAPDGTDVRVLAGTDEDDRSSWSPVEDGRLTLSDRIAPCKVGDIVPQPQDNPLLVEDCETLLTIRNTFAYDPDSLNWDADTPISWWNGVYLGGNPLRVEAIQLTPGLVSGNFTGIVRPEFGRLTGLKSLIIIGYVTGPIPSELGNLPNLEYLYVEGTIIGCIPPRLRGKVGGYTEPEHCKQ